MAITGVIRPPPEIRAVADRTALYVAKNGRAFEARILKSEKAKTPKFAFLQPTSPFHAYYEDRIQFYEAGGEDGDNADNNNNNNNNNNADNNNKKEGAEKKQQENTTTTPKETTVRKTEKTQKASAIDPIAKALLGQRNKIQQARAKQKEESKEGGEEGGGPETTPPMSLPPPPPLELVTIVAPSNLSVVQIETIQLVAQFAAMDGKGGPFLQQLTLREWTNSVFSFCQPRHAHFAYFSALVDAYRRILGQWTASANSKSMTSGTPLDVQASLQQAAYRAEYERELLQMKSQQEEGEVVAIDWQDFVVVETIDFPEDEKVELSMLPPPPPPKIQVQPSVAAKPEHEGMDESEDEEEEETIRVVPSYTPKVVGTANPLQARAIDPITGKSVSVADMPEHMRIQLMDPKWAEERKKFQEKQKDSNLVSGDAIASNISRFAQARGDLFGKSEQELLSKEKDSKKRLEEANRIIREQQTGQPVASGGGAGSSGKTGAPAMDFAIEPAAKRARVDNVSPPPPPPPMAGAIPVTRAVAPPVSAPVPAGEPQLSGDPMADAGDVEIDGMESKLIPAAEFAASLTKTDVTLQIRIPNDPSQMAWNFYGQILSMSVNVMSKVKMIKEELSRMHLNGMPANKIQFKATATGFLKDNLTLADLNIGPSATVELIPKTRGGRK